MIEENKHSHLPFPQWDKEKDIMIQVSIPSGGSMPIALDREDYPFYLSFGEKTFRVQQRRTVRRSFLYQKFFSRSLLLPRLVALGLEKCHDLYRKDLASQIFFLSSQLPNVKTLSSFDYRKRFMQISGLPYPLWQDLVEKLWKDGKEKERKDL